jgi:hypothetical protein
MLIYWFSSSMLVRHTKRDRKIYVFRQSGYVCFLNCAVVIVVNCPPIYRGEQFFVAVFDFHKRAFLLVVSNTRVPAISTTRNADVSRLALAPVTAVTNCVVSADRTVADAFVSIVSAKMPTRIGLCLHLSYTLRA